MSDLSDGVSAAAPSPDDGKDPSPAFPPSAGASLGLPGIEDDPTSDGGGSQGMPASPKEPGYFARVSDAVLEPFRNIIEDPDNKILGFQMPQRLHPWVTDLRVLSTPGLGITALLNGASAALNLPPHALSDIAPGLMIPEVPHYVPRAARAVPQESIEPIRLRPLGEGTSAAPAEIAPVASEPPPPESSAPAASKTPDATSGGVDAPAGTAPPTQDQSPGPAASTKIRAPGKDGADEDALPFHDGIEDFREFSNEKGYVDDLPLTQHNAARGYVMQGQHDTDAEHIAAYDADANAVTHAGTSLHGEQSTLPGDLVDTLSDPSRHFIIHHSHPDDSALSGADVALLGRPGMLGIAAHGAGGELSAARLTPEAKAALASKMEADPWGSADILEKLSNGAANASWDPMAAAIQRGEFTEDEGHRIWTEVANRALARNGVIDYVTSHNLPPSSVIDEMQDDADNEVRNSVQDSIPGFKGRLPDHPPSAVRVGDGMAQISRWNDEAAPGQSRRAKGGASGAQSVGDTARPERKDAGGRIRQIAGRADGGALRPAPSAIGVGGLARSPAQIPSAVGDRRVLGDAADRGTLGRRRFSEGGGTAPAGKEGRAAVRIAGDELGRKPESYGKLQMLAARYARERLDGSSVTNHQTGLPITLAWPRTLRRATLPGTPPALLLAIPALPTLLAQGRYAGSVPDPRQRPAVKAVHYFRSDADVAGAPMAMRLAVRQHHTGKCFFDGMEKEDGGR